MGGVGVLLFSLLSLLLIPEIHFQKPYICIPISWLHVVILTKTICEREVFTEFWGTD